MQISAELYRQFEPGPASAEPAGWQSIEIELAPAHTALVVMHAWDTGEPSAYPGWYRAVGYLPRAQAICRDVLPPLLAAVRRSPLALFHVVGGRDYYRHLPGYERAARLAGPSRPLLQVAPDPVHQRLVALRQAHAFPGAENVEDIARGFARLGFAETALPHEGEGIAENGEQLAALCRAGGINHLIYVGFALNWCLLMSPGGMVDMARHGCLCSTIAEAVTAVENRESAATEAELRQALWRVSVEFGFVFRLDPFLQALTSP